MTEPEAQVRELCDTLAATALTAARNLQAIPVYQRVRHLPGANVRKLAEAAGILADVLRAALESPPSPKPGDEAWWQDWNAMWDGLFAGWRERDEQQRAEWRRFRRELERKHYD